ncbi:hypothetical protein HDU88_000103 [Geranomyces variabilis]|nr:hypothetical protein HDU88_000103 [Geranomyces variabilis]
MSFADRPPSPPAAVPPTQPPPAQPVATSTSTSKPRRTKAAKGCGVCTQFKTIRRAPIKETFAAGTAMSGSSSALQSATPSPSAPYKPFPCPPDSSSLGSSTWTFLHTMAAYYPETPTKAEQLSMRNMISALTRFYPCGDCAEHLTQEVIRNPPVVTSNRALSNWFCQVHNEVNERQGKPKFDCSKVFERWKDGTAGDNCFSELGDH